MSELVASEFALFLYAVRLGFLMAFFYDVLRVFRRVVGHNRLAIAFEDLLYWLWAGLEIFMMLYEYHNGSLRFYMILGTGLGIWLYTASVGVCFVRFSAKILNKTKESACRAAEKAGKKAESVFEKPKRILFSKIYAFRVLGGKKSKQIFRYCKKKLTSILKMTKMVLCKR